MALSKKAANALAVLSLCMAAICALTAAAAAHAVFKTQQEQEAVLREIGVDERLGDKVPAGLVFMDENGREAALGSYFRGRPVLLSLNYYECPMLCPVTFGNLVRTIREMKGLAPGADFGVVTLSINPDETVAEARGRADETYAMLKGYRDPSSWWAFLVGGEKDINALTRAVGFRYKRVDKVNFAHPSVLVVLTPDGRVSRYLYGVEQDEKDLRLALIEASGGRIGASAALNKALLFCYHYDPVGRKYQLFALNIVRALGAAAALGLGALLLALWLLDRRKKTDA